MAGHTLRRRSATRKRAYRILTTLLAPLGLSGLFSLRFVRLYSHRVLAFVLLLGRGWALVTRAWLARKGWLHRGLHSCRDGTGRHHLLQAAGRATFCAASSVVCLAVVPRSAEMAPLIVLLGEASLVRVAASFLVPHRMNVGSTLVNVPDIRCTATAVGPDGQGGIVAS